MRLTVAQQRKLLKALPAHRVAMVRKACNCKEQGGTGVKSAMTKARKALGPIAAEIGPVVMKEFIMPMIMKKLKGEGKSALKKHGKRSSRCPAKRKK